MLCISALLKDSAQYEIHIEKCPFFNVENAMDKRVCTRNVYCVLFPNTKEWQFVTFSVLSVCHF